MGFSIAIDGPAGAGKSTLARKLANKLSFVYVDTGAVYRTLALYCLNNNININDEDEVSINTKNTDIEIKYIDGDQQVFLNGCNVTDKIRSEEVSRTASITSAYKSTRSYLLKMQRDIALHHNVVMDGRDIGTIVLPNADIKIFLVASLDERAKRRVKEFASKGIIKSYDEVYKDIEERDIRDSSRAIAPLKKADDAIILDTTGMSVDDEVQKVIDIYNAKVL